MEDHLAQLRLLWKLALGFERSLAANVKISQWTSLLAAAGVLVLPFEFWYLETLAVVNAVNGIRSTQRPLLDGAPDAGQSSDKVI